MPLPAPPQMVSRRLKKPKPLPFRPAQPSQSFHKLSPLPTERRLRVICTDPDATDSSSDEDPDANVKPRLTRKRLVHEICLPAVPASDFYQSQQQGMWRGSGAFGSPRKAMTKRKGGPKVARKEVSLQDLDAILGAAAGICVGNSPREDERAACLREEEFSLFVSEYFVLPDDGNGGGSGASVWDDGLDLPEDEGFTEMLDLELDSEALKWINSLQRLV